MQSNLNGENVQPFFNRDGDCSCPYRPSVQSVMTVDNTVGHYPLIYWVSLEGHLNIAHADGCGCSTVMSPTYNNGLSPSSLTVDKMNIYWSNDTSDRIYYVNKIYTDEGTVREFYLANVKSIKAVGKSLQFYPSADCLMPHQVLYNVEEVSKTSTSIMVKLPPPVLHSNCKEYNLPTTLYTIYITQCLENDPSKCEDADKIKLQTYEQVIEVKELKPFTKYQFKLALSNYYTDLESMSLEFSSGIILRTGAGAPTAPENVTVQALTPTSAVVYWMPPKVLNAAAIHYEVHWRSVTLVNGKRPKGEQVIKHIDKPRNKKFSAHLDQLLPGQEYLIFVRAYPAEFNEAYSESPGNVVKTYSDPNNLTLSGVSVNSLNVSWVLPENVSVGYILEYTAWAGIEKWQMVNISTVVKNQVHFYVPNLLPKSLYKFRLLLRYPTLHTYLWPRDDGFTFNTLGWYIHNKSLSLKSIHIINYYFQITGDVPSAPGKPIVTKLRNAVFQLNWEPARAHGSQITLYTLEGRVVEDQADAESLKNKSDNWNLYYNGTDNYWIIMGDMDHKYVFRVKAKNEYGFGAWSESSSLVDLIDNASGMLASKQNIGLVLGLSVPLLAIIILCFCYFLCRKFINYIST